MLKQKAEGCLFKTQEKNKFEIADFTDLEDEGAFDELVKRKYFSI
jgi:hypothetical protein